MTIIILLILAILGLEIYVYFSLIGKKDSLFHEVNDLKNEIISLELENNSLTIKNEETKKSIDAVNAEYKEKRKIEIDFELDNYAKEKELEKQELETKLNESYEELLGNIQAQADVEIFKINELKTEELRLKDNVAAAIAAAKREKEIKEKSNFYKIQLSKEDIEEIDIIQESLKHIKRKNNSEAIQKIIWKIYYEKPVNDLLNRILKPSEDCGIYKITDPESGLCYIGQSVNLRNRLKQHIKAGLDINSSNNKLYTTMKETGPENFTYEVLEICDRQSLNKQERYWIDFYQSNTWGLNTLKGVNN